jgi:hypothetical protein
MAAAGFSIPTVLLGGDLVYVQRRACSMLGMPGAVQVPDWHGATSARVCPVTQRAGAAARDTRVSLRALLTCTAPNHIVHAAMQLQAPPARAVADVRWLGQDRVRCGSGSHAHALGARLHHGECVGARRGDLCAANQVAERKGGQKSAWALATCIAPWDGGRLAGLHLPLTWRLRSPTSLFPTRPVAPAVMPRARATV